MYDLLVLYLRILDFSHVTDTPAFFSTLIPLDTGQFLHLKRSMSWSEWRELILYSLDKPLRESSSFLHVPNNASPTFSPAQSSHLLTFISTLHLIFANGRVG